MSPAAGTQPAGREELLRQEVEGLQERLAELAGERAALAAEGERMREQILCLRTALVSTLLAVVVLEPPGEPVTLDLGGR